MNNKIVYCLVLSLLTTGTFAQTLNYQSFINAIQLRNAEYVANKLNIDICQAEIEAAHTCDDPSIALEYGNNSDWSLAMGQSASAELSKALPLGKTAARVAVAKQQLKLSQATFNDFWRNLKADATIDFYKALLAKELLLIDSQAYLNIATLASSDSLRFVKGEISEIDMLQSRLEQYRAQQELNNKQTDYLNSLVLLDERCGTPTQATRNVVGRLAVPTRMFCLQQLLDQALSNRSDLVAAEENVLLTQQQNKLDIRERRPDVELSLGVNYNSRVRNQEAPAPPFVGYSIGLSIPLPITSVNSGVRNAASLRLQQAQLQSLSVKNSIQSEVTRSYNVYLSSLQRVKAYNDILMVNAQQVLDGKLYAYQRGDTSLLEVLTAQHTFNEIREEYATCLYDCMVALVELERCVGL